MEEKRTMRKHLKVIMLGFVILVWGVCSSTSGRAYGAISTATMQEIDRVNEKGPYLGIVVPNSFEMNPLLQSPSFVADLEVPYLDYFGNHQYITTIYVYFSAKVAFSMIIVIIFWALRINFFRSS